MFGHCSCSSTRLRSLRHSFVLLRNQPHAGAWPRWQREHAIGNLEPLERIVEQTIELAEFAGVLDAGHRTGKMQRLRGEEPAANGGAKPILNVRSFAQPRGCKRVAQAAKLRNLKAHRIDRT